mmetsp:Transcript_19338/g.40906  ORF Transcript_19338/g.40906 Transcript_19338/m.40906 type:complete len:208 (-) Transcript_19338:200-823(-)
MRRHVCHQLRAGFRLPARQPCDFSRGGCAPADAQLLCGRRGRLCADRRGARAADHLWPRRRADGAVRRRSQARKRDGARRALHRLREGPERAAHRRGRAILRGGAPAVLSLRPQSAVGLVRHQRPQGQGALCEGQVVPSSRRRGADHRRVFRPRDGRAALVRRSAPERRGQRGAHCPAGDGGGRVGHLPVALQALRQARLNVGNGAD